MNIKTVSRIDLTMVLFQILPGSFQVPGSVDSLARVIRDQDPYSKSVFQPCPVYDFGSSVL